MENLQYLSFGHFQIVQVGCTWHGFEAGILGIQKAKRWLQICGVVEEETVIEVPGM